MDSTSFVAAVDTDIPPLQEKYDVFLSFRGEDTRKTFTSHLHAALLRKNIDTYIDRRLERGDEIAPALLKAIERSKIALVIFSEDYASSTWCLKELVHILGCKKSHGQIVIPIFYRIDPSHVRKQQGTCALEDRPLKRSRDEVANWRAALEEAANMSGFPYSSRTGRTEADFVEEVVQDVLTKLNRESSSDLRGLFGIQRKIEKIESLLCLDTPGVCCVGIWGMGGIGKTTLADAVFHRHSSKFEVCCFLANVREKSEKTDGLNELRNTLVRELLKDKDVNINTPSIPPHIQDRLRRTKAFIVLDDVNAREHLEVLVGDDDRFCQGSRIIITARDKGLLEQKVDQEKIYSVEGLGSDEALELFHSHAFGNKSPTTDYTELSREVVDYIKGIPLALKVMGSSFRRCKSKQEWEVQWKKVKQFPNEEIDQVLRISYDGLGKNEKEIFLDIACFHKGYLRKDVEIILDSCDCFGEVGINDLIDRSLISISQDMRFKKLGEASSGGQIVEMQSVERIEMHDLVQEMGRAIARKQGSRLFNADDVYKALTNNQRDGHVQAISFDMNKIEKMYQLRWLRVSYSYLWSGSLHLPNSLRYLYWEGYPLESLPSKFSAQNLLVLDTPYSDFGVQLWNEDQSPVNLKRVNLQFCRYLTEVPNLSQCLNIEHIDLEGCESLVEIPSYFQHLGKLTYLNLSRCYKIKNLPEMPCNLEFLDLSWTRIEELPSSVWSHEKISHLDIRNCGHLKSLPSNSCKLKLSNSFSLKGCKSLCEMWELPRNTTVLELSGTTIKELRNTSIESVVGLTAIKLINCKSLVSLPTNIWKLKSLESLDLSGCSKFQHFPEISEAMKHLEFLNLSGTMVKEVPPSIGNLVALQKLDLSGCSKFQHFPEISEAMKHLEFLNLSGTMVKEVPPSIGNLVALRKLDLGDSKYLEVVQDYLFRLTSLQELDLSSTKIKSLPASIKQAAHLSSLFLNDCKSLESLPELPPLLQCLQAHGCTSLTTVSSSSTAIIQGWEEYIFYRGLYEKHVFSDCRRLDENARSNIMGDAQLRILRMATASSNCSLFFTSLITMISISMLQGFLRKRSSVAIRFCGNEIPKWFSHKSEGCSIKIELPRDWFSTDFLGFALSFVVVAATRCMEIGCKYNFKTSNGESHEVSHYLYNLFPTDSTLPIVEDSNGVFVWWYNNVFEEVVKGAESPTAFYKLVTEVNVDFTVMDFFDPKLNPVEKCGICLLYGKDAEMIKQRAL
ncbi:disease resistance protein RUN1-like [Prunus dulcis]|nr:disease resistance protein RUN1-like [Prunus dulcis]